MLSEKQREYRREANKTWNIKIGATRSGKTYGDYYLLPKRLLDVRGRDGLNVILGNTRGTIQRNIIEPMQTIWGPDMVSSIHSDNTADFFGERVHCLGADNTKHVDRLRGQSIKYCYGDEVVTWAPEVFSMLQSRLDKEYSLFDGACNPEGPTHWFKEKLDRGGEDWYVQHYTIYDNPFLPEKVKRRMERDYQGTVYWGRYILGEWTQAEGVIYRRFSDQPEAFFYTGKPEKIVIRQIGVDFGGNGSATTFTLSGVSSSLHDWYVMEEFYNKKIIGPEELNAKFIEFVKMCQAKYGQVAVVYCDSAEQTLIQGMRVACMRARLPVDIRNARKGSINDRIRFTCSMQGAGRFHINPECRETIRAMQSAVWDPKAVGVDSRLDDGKHNIDSLDAMEYSIETLMPELMAMA